LGGEGPLAKHQPRSRNSQRHPVVRCEVVGADVVTSHAAGRLLWSAWFSDDIRVLQASYPVHARVMRRCQDTGQERTPVARTDPASGVPPSEKSRGFGPGGVSQYHIARRHSIDDGRLNRLMRSLRPIAAWWSLSKGHITPGGCRQRLDNLELADYHALQSRPRFRPSLFVATPLHEKTRLHHCAIPNPWSRVAVTSSGRSHA
jgi:hypothetical protein